MKRRRVIASIIGLMLLLFVVLPGSFTLVVGWDFARNIPRSTLFAVMENVPLIIHSETTASYMSPDGAHVVGVRKSVDADDVQFSVFITKVWDAPLFGAEWLLWFPPRECPWVRVNVTWLARDHVRIEHGCAEPFYSDEGCTSGWDGVTVECVSVHY